MRLTVLHPVLSIVIVYALVPASMQAQERMQSARTLFSWCGCPSPPGELGPIVTDRPDFTEASSTVGLGVYQIEAGYSFFENDDAVRTTTHSWGEPLIRVGVFANWLEFRAALFPVSQRVQTGFVTQNNSGTGDLYLGFKIALTPQEGLFPEMAILPQMTVPTGDNAFTNNLTLPGANLLYSWELDEQTSIGASTQFNQAVDGTGNEYTEWAQSIAFGRSLTEQIGCYAEYYGLYPHQAIGVTPEHYVNGGFTYLIGEDIQLDIRVGAGLNNGADDFFTGAGISMRMR